MIDQKEYVEMLYSALEDINTAINKGETNPYVYRIRSNIYQSMGNIEATKKISSVIKQ